jgi:hypothetical protein
MRKVWHKMGNWMYLFDEHGYTGKCCLAQG